MPCLGEYLKEKVIIGYTFVVTPPFMKEVHLRQIGKYKGIMHYLVMESHGKALYIYMVHLIFPDPLALSIFKCTCMSQFLQCLYKLEASGWRLATWVS